MRRASGQAGGLPCVRHCRSSTVYAIVIAEPSGTGFNGLQAIGNRTRGAEQLAQKPGLKPIHRSVFSRFDCILSVALTTFAVRAYKWTQFNGDTVHNGNKISVPPAVWHARARRSECARGFREYSDGSSRWIRLAMGARTCHDVLVLISMTARAYRTWYRDASASRVSLVVVPRQSWL